MEPNESGQLFSYTTKGYKLHYLEALSGLRFVLTTDPTIETLQVRRYAKFTHISCICYVAGSCFKQYNLLPLFIIWFQKQDLLQKCYEQFVECVVKNALYTPGDLVDCPRFSTATSELLRSHPHF